MSFGNYSHYLIRKFINHLMVDGKKEKAEKIFFQCFFDLYQREKKNPFFIFMEAIENSKPFLEIRSVRRGGATYQIPVPCHDDRGVSLSMKWLLEAAKKKKGEGSFAKSLSSVFLESSKKGGENVKKRELLHNLALKNRSLTHYRWF